jgi:hypothetical protein
MLTRRATARSGNENAKAFHRARIFGTETTRNAAQPQDVALFALARHKILAQNPHCALIRRASFNRFWKEKRAPEKATPATRGRLSRESQ